MADQRLRKRACPVPATSTPESKAQTLQKRLVLFGAEILQISSKLPNTWQASHVAKGSRKNNLAESAALNPTGDLTNAQFPMLNSHPKWMSDCLRMRIENWELNIGQILPSPDFRSSCVAVPDFLCKAFYTLPSKIHWGGCIRRSGTE